MDKVIGDGIELPSWDLSDLYNSTKSPEVKRDFNELDKLTKCFNKKYRGKISDTIKDILGGVRSSCTYVGAPSLKQLSKCTTFVRVTKQYNDTFVK